MYPVHDVDAILLLALSLASKRRPARLVEIIAATDLSQGAIPGETKLSDAFARLSAYGLIIEQDGGYALSADAQLMMSGHAKKAKNPERIHDLKENLADYHLNGEHPMIALSAEQIAAAISEHQTAKRSSGRQWLMPKVKPAEDFDKRTGQRIPFKSFSTRRRKG